MTSFKTFLLVAPFTHPVSIGVLFLFQIIVINSTKKEKKSLCPGFITTMIE